MPAPTAFEQYMMELVNRERATAGVQPLAFDFDLNESADAHTQWMIAADTFSHDGAGGSSPHQRIEASGYPLSGSWATGENIAWQSERGAAGIQDDVAQLHVNLMNSAGHRSNILNPTYRELGVGIDRGAYQGWDGVFATQNFGKTGQAFFITGVAFDDLDGDVAYDVGEGLGGLTVTVTTGAGVTVASTTTYAEAGGYELAVQPGTYTISGGAGADTFHSFGEAGLDRILDFNRAKGDRVNLVAGSTYSYGQLGGDVVINITGGARIELMSVQMASLSGDWLTVG